MKLADADRKRLLPLLEQLGGAVEDLLLSGLTTASDATRQTLNIAFQEAARMRLLKLGSTLRIASEELGRFTRNEADFSRQRLSFFLNRAWLLGQGLARALRENDEAAFDRLLWVPADRAVDRLEVVTVGVGKKVIRGAACTFEFRLRLVSPAADRPAGTPLRWSCVFPVKPGTNIPAEAYLHLPQKQKFKAAEFLDGTVMTIQHAALALDDVGGRINLGERSTVTAGDEFEDWASLQTWNPQAALARIQKHQVGPFDLDIEMQEEVMLKEWQLGAPAPRDDGRTAFPVTTSGVVFDAMVSPGEEGAALLKALGEFGKKKRRPPLFGLMHYERCRLVLQPLTTFGKDGPKHLMISGEKLNRAELLKALNLTS
jgi:hypothetical protein